MNHYSFTALVIALFFLFIPVFSQSQFTGFSVNPKSGIFIWPSHNNGAVMGIEANYLRNGYIFSLDFYQFHEIKLLSSLSNEAMFRQVGIMAGKYYGDRLFRVQIQGGIAPIWEIGENEPLNPNFSTVGLVLKSGVKFIPMRFLSIGFDLQSNLNSKKPLIMPLVSLEIGRLRNKINKP